VEPKNFDVAVAILSWLAEEVERELRQTMGGAKLKVIRAEYEGAHPVIAIRYNDGHQGDLGPSVSATIAGLVERKTIRDFIDYLGKRKTDWRAKTDELMKAGDKGR